MRSYFRPNMAPSIALPNFLSMPPLVVGIPVDFVNARFALVMPNALFHEKLKPGILVFDILLNSLDYGAKVRFSYIKSFYLAMLQ